MFFRRTSQKYSDASDEQLLQMIDGGDTRAFDELYGRYSNRLLGYFLKMLNGNAAKAQDFLQDIFLKVLEKCNQFKSDARFSTWIFAIAHNMCKNEYRRLHVRRILDYDADPDQEQSGDEFSALLQQLDADNLQRQVMRELGNFDENQRTTFILRFQENCSIREISEMLGCAEGTTKSRLFYVSKKLARKFGQLAPEKKEESTHEL